MISLDMLQSLRSLRYKGTVSWRMNTSLARCVSQREDVTLKRWAGLARYRRRMARQRERF